MATREPVLDLGRLRLLREVSLRGSIAAAARARGISASAVSQQLATLERETGVALVDRTVNGVVMTAAGVALAQRAGEALDVLAAARADLDRLSGAVAGRVRLAAVASAAATFVSAACSGLWASRPGVELTVNTAEPDTAIAGLLAGDIDIAVVDEYDYVPLAWPDYVVTTALCEEPLVVVSHVSGAVASLLDRPSGVRLADLAGQRWVMPPQSAACGAAVRSACRAAGFEPEVAWESDDMTVLAAAVRDGHGVAVLPRLSVPGADGGLLLRPLREPELHRRLLAVARASVLARPVVRDVLDALTAASAAAVA